MLNDKESKSWYYFTGEKCEGQGLNKGSVSLSYYGRTRTCTHIVETGHAAVRAFTIHFFQLFSQFLRNVLICLSPNGLIELNRVELMHGFLNEVKSGPSIDGGC